MKSIIQSFKDFGRALAKGDIGVKLSLLIFGLGHILHKQVIKGLLLLLMEAGMIYLFIVYSLPNLAKFGTLGTVKRELTFDPLTFEQSVNKYDNSFLILLNGIVSLILILVFLIILIDQVKSAYELQQLKEQKRHINSFSEDVSQMFNRKFHVTLLSLPGIGIIVMNIIPIFVLIAVAFTNYDGTHLPPKELFTWVGFANFKAFFSADRSAGFAYSFWNILVWTLVWAFFATFTNFIGGILLAKFINNKNTIAPKLWRTLFVITIAVPQFVTLVLVRNFFKDSGIANTICRNIGLTGLFNKMGLISGDTIPFLTKAGWARVMVILINIWIGVPYQMLIATGVLMNIPQDQIESARIDGASNFQIFWKIIMPYILIVQGPALITDFVRNINNFNVIYLLTQDVYVETNMQMAGASARKTDLLVTWLFRLTNESNNYKMASVIGIIVFIISAAFTLITYSRTIKGDREEVFQ